MASNSLHQYQAQFIDVAHFAGDMTLLRVLNTPMLVISSADIAQDLMEKRSALYSDRQKSTIDTLYVTLYHQHNTLMVMLSSEQDGALILHSCHTDHGGEACEENSTSTSIKRPR